MFRQSGCQGPLPRPLEDSRPPEIPFEWDRLVVLANRAPYRRERAPNGRITHTRTASGLVTALEPLVAACSGSWVTHGADADDADEVFVNDRPAPLLPYRVRRVPLDNEQHRGDYFGFADEALWPLCHAVGVAPIFRSSDFQQYDEANTRFAHAAAEEAGSGASVVLVQDYHFALAPRRLRNLLPSSTILAFWHIPWPHARVLRTCPWHRELLDGMLGSDIAGFQTREDAANFIDCVRSLLRADVDSRDAVAYRSASTQVGVYPVGVEWDNAVMRSTPAAPVCRAHVLRDLDIPEQVILGIGVDRLDHAKGLNEKFLAIERALERCPTLRGRFTFVQVAEPSRESLPGYRDTRVRLHETTARVNNRFGTTSYTPIRLLEAHHDAAEVYRLYRAADICYVGSLHDGMNLVAKEFVCARDDERGVLILSEFAGASQQLRTAVLVNPYAIDASAEALVGACVMPAAEQSARMRVLRANVRASGARWWAGRLLTDARDAHRSIAARGKESTPLCRRTVRRASDCPESPALMLKSRLGGTATNASSSVPSSPT